MPQLKNVILLTRASECQYYCANQLFLKGYLTHLILEEGSSSIIRKKTFSDYFAVLTLVFRHPLQAGWKVFNGMMERKYFGRQEFHNKRILSESYKVLDENITSHAVSNINSHEVLDLIKSINPEIILVFGTAMISKDIIAQITCPMINLHWGLSPKYRGEGIVSALYQEGTGDLGVTVHHIDAKSDSGDIIMQRKINVDEEENFYSIGCRLTKAGTELFLLVLDQFFTKQALKCDKQDLTKGKLYSTHFMWAHPDWKWKAYQRLKKEYSNHVHQNTN